MYEGPPLRETIDRPLTTAHYGDEMSEIKEAIANEMWKVLHKQAEELGSLVCSLPFSIVDFTSPKNMEVENAYLLEDMQTMALVHSKLTLRSMPSYIGKYE